MAASSHAPPSVATDPRVAELHSLTLAAAELVDEIGDLAERDRANRAAGYRLAARTFFRHGVEVGREQVLAAIIDGQDDTRRRLARVAREPVWSELERIRREPGNLWRFSDGKVSEPDFYTINLFRHGCVQYAGGPVPVW
ncbi:MAG: hypothetical protein JWP40_3541 [Blastococcus sp.]|nr:hypothetical protein [Blastococcus sp.]